MVSRRFRSTLASLVLLVVALPLISIVVAGCGKKNTDHTVPPIIIARKDADDIVQHLSATMSADAGGWYRLVKALSDTLTKTVLPGETPPVTPPPPQTYSLTFGGITYNLVITCYDTLGRVQARRDSATDWMDIHLATNVGGTLNHNGVDGTYGFRSDTESVVINLSYGAADTIEFSSNIEDSTFAKVTSQFDATSQRLWFHEDNFFDFIMNIRRDQLGSNPYPLANSEMEWILEAFPLGSPGRNDHTTDVLAEIHMTFDGTENATLTLYDTIADDQPAYSYKVNLNTGVLTRLN